MSEMRGEHEPRRWEQFKRPARRGRNNSKEYMRQREAEIVRLQRAGFTRKQIGELLDPPMSEVGVKSAIRQMRKKAQQ